MAADPRPDRATTRPEEWAVAKPLNIEAMKEVFAQIQNAPPHPCQLGQHVVSPTVYRDGGWTNCANCGRAVYCEGDPLSAASREEEE